MGSQEIRIGDLQLDLENPRISRAVTQREALQKILQDQDFRLAVLAESIVEEGLNPMDRLLVIADSENQGKFVVIEGNRRLAAIRLLLNPAALTDLEARPSVQKRFETLAKDFDWDADREIGCFGLPDRAAGATWIRQRHTGANGGKGIVNWNGLATARYRGQDPALQALDLVLKFGNLTEEEKSGIEERFPITTLDRLLSTPAVRSKIGVDVKKDKLLTDLPPDEIIKPLRRMVRDLANGTVNVTMLKRKDQQTAWVDTLGDDLPDLTKKKGEAKPVEAIDEKAFPKKVKAKAAARTKNPRKALIPKDCVLNVTNAKIAEIEKELRTLPLENFRHSVSVLFRVFLELSVDHYSDANGLTPQNDQRKLNAKLKAVVADLISKGTKKSHLDGVSKAIDNAHNPLHTDTLHNYVHNRFYSPQERELKTAWDNAQIFFEKVWP